MTPPATTTDTLPPRSALFTPGNRAEVLRKALNSPADMLIFDLEDAVAPSAKDSARQIVADVILEAQRPVVVRVNGLETTWCAQDVAMACGAGAHAVLFPKVETVKQLDHAEDLMAAHDPGGHAALWSMIETPLGVLHAPALAERSLARRARQTTWVVGLNDLYTGLRAQPTRDRAAVVTALSQVVLAARAYGLAVLDSVYNDFRDLDGFAEVCQQGRLLGFDGKTLIHPAQVELCNTIFGPSEDERAWAQRVVEAFADPAHEGVGVLQLDGQMVELLHRDAALRLLARSATGPAT